MADTQATGAQGAVELDGRTVGEGHRGPITAKIQSLFFDVVNGKVPARAGWLTKV